MNDSIQRTLILSCSPRKDGNSDEAARLIGEEFAAQRPNVPFDLRSLSEFIIRPCIACDFCASHPGTCSLEEQDEAKLLLSALCSPNPGLPASVIVSPIYFYHLPARLKALLDRSQDSWHLPPQEKPGRDAKLAVVLLAARKQGSRLFEGALLTLRYVAAALGLTLIDPLTLYGLDVPNALSGDAEAQTRVREYARSLIPVS